MWIFLHNAFLSVTADPGNPRLLQVRSRFPGDIERLWPRAVVVESAERDYRYASWISRSDVSRKIRDELESLHYDDLIEKVISPVREEAYIDVWSAMRNAQNEGVRRQWAQDKEARGPQKKTAKGAAEPSARAIGARLGRGAEPSAPR